MHWNPAVGIPLLVLGLIVLALVWFFGKPRKAVPTRHAGRGREAAGGARREPTLGDDDAPASFADVVESGEDPDAPVQGQLDVDMREELERLGATLAGTRASAARAPGSMETAPGVAPTPAPAAASRQPSMPVRSTIGRRPPELPIERIVSLHVVAREGSTFRGSDLVVAMEKAGLEYGDMGIFHRLLDGKQDEGAVFSVANMVKPGGFDVAALAELETPGLAFFMALPGPMPALDAWDMMLPTAQRLAKLLEGLLLDEQRNALGRQRIAHIRDELRGWDRQHQDV